MTIALGCIYGLGMLFFSIIFLVDWIRSRGAIKKYFKFGLGFALLVVGLDLLTVLITPSAWTPTLWLGLALEPIVMVRIIGFTMLGMFYAASNGYPSFPLLLRRFKSSAVEESAQPAVQVPEDEAILSELEESASVVPEIQAVKAEAADVLITINWKHYSLVVVGASLAGILYSSLLFLLTNPKMSELVQQAFGTSSVNQADDLNFQTFMVLLQFAIAEEIVFRLGIQNFLVKYLKLQNGSTWIAIVIASALWTIGHAGVLDPEWVKFVQIFPLGLLLGWLYNKFGLESTMLVHTIFNFALVILAGYLIG